MNVTGTPGTVIPSGFQFATPATLTASVMFEALESVTLDGEPDEDYIIRILDAMRIGSSRTGCVADYIR